MGTPIGFFADDGPNDYPNLNKCPDCETYFEGPNCPLCGKECPPQMRAGNRKPQKKRRRTRHSSGRVRFVPWYYSTWFLIAMLIVFPLVGLILLWTSDNGRGWKVAGTAACVGVWLFSRPLLSFVLSLLLFNDGPLQRPDLPQSAYCASCEVLDAEGYYRQPGNYPERDVTLTVTVREVFYDETGACVWRCVWSEGEQELLFFLVDYLEEDIHLLAGDRITVWGRTLGSVTAYDADGTRTVRLPGVAVFYLDLHTGEDLWGSPRVLFCGFCKKNRSEKAKITKKLLTNWLKCSTIRAIM